MNNLIPTHQAMQRVGRLLERQMIKSMTPRLHVFQKRRERVGFLTCSLKPKPDKDFIKRKLQVTIPYEYTHKSA